MGIADRTSLNTSQRRDLSFPFSAMEQATFARSVFKNRWLFHPFCHQPDSISTRKSFCLFCGLAVPDCIPRRKDHKSPFLTIMPVPASPVAGTKAPSTFTFATLWMTIGPKSRVSYTCISIHCLEKITLHPSSNGLVSITSLNCKTSVNIIWRTYWDWFWPMWRWDFFFYPPSLFSSSSCFFPNHHLSQPVISWWRLAEEALAAHLAGGIGPTC